MQRSDDPASVNRHPDGRSGSVARTEGRILCAVSDVGWVGQSAEVSLSTAASTAARGWSPSADIGWEAVICVMLTVLGRVVFLAPTDCPSRRDDAPRALIRGHGCSVNQRGVQEDDLRSNDGKADFVVAPACERIAPAGAFPCLLYTSPSPRDKRQSRMPSSA